MKLLQITVALLAFRLFEPKRVVPTDMVSTRSQLSLLLWKNYKLQRRRPVGTCCEILLPVFFFVIIVIGRSLLEAEDVPAKTGCHMKQSPYDYMPRPLEHNNGGGGDDTFDCNDLYVGGWMFNAESELDWNDPNRVTVPIEVYYTPDNVHTKQVADLISANMYEYNGIANQNRPDVNFTFIGVPDDLGAINAATDAFRGLAIIFRETGTNTGLWTDTHTTPCDAPPADCNPQVSYDLRIPQDCWGRFTDDGNNQEWFTDRSFREFEKPGIQAYGPYGNCAGFTLFQLSIERALTTFFHHNGVEPSTVLRLKPFPFPAFVENRFIDIVKNMMPTVLIMTYLYSVISIIRVIVTEKETRIKEAMLMMGLPNWINWLAWFIKSFLFMMVSMVLVTGLLFGGDVFIYSEPAMVFIFFLLFSTSTITLCFLISSLFSSANMAAISGGVIYFLCYVPYFLVDNFYADISGPEKHAACLLAPTCAGLGIRLIANYEIAGLGLTGDTFSQDPTERDDFGGSKIFGMMLADTILYLALALYIERVFPGEYGIPQPPWFFLKPSFWFPSLARGTISTDIEDSATQSDSHEAEPTGKRVGVELINLRKEFGSKVAVDGISLRMFEEQITVLLGHNGAGKSTTMSMMVGLFPPSSGDVTINGHSVSKNIGKARESLGLCPQFDVLWDTMTVSEHLYFFGRLKGLSGKVLRKEIKTYIEDLELDEKKKARSKTLSGGQKRALSVGIALIGGSQTVILDEPTSGMDPQKRRHTWDLLLKHKKGRTILLTTHFMDEADLLGDRIAIMSEGKVRCMGSSSFLKQRFGVGYHLTLVKEDECDTTKVFGFVQSAIPNAILADDVGSEITVILPTTSTSQFPQLFTELENSQQTLRVASFGVSVSTLEEVFLNVGENESASAIQRKKSKKAILSKKESLNQESAKLVDSNADNNAATEVTLGLRLRQFRAMFMKRAIHSMRRWRIIIIQVILPVAFVCASMAIALLEVPETEVPCRDLSLTNYEGGSVRYSSQDLGADYYHNYPDYVNAASASLGSKSPNTKQQRLASAAMSAITLLGGGAIGIDSTGTNLTAMLLDDSQDYFKTGYLEETVTAISFEQGIYRLDTGPSTGACDFYLADTNLTDNGTVTNPSISLQPNQLYFFVNPTDYIGSSGSSCIAVSNNPNSNCQSEHPGNSWDEELFSSATGYVESSSASLYLFNTSGLSDGAGPYYYYCGNDNFGSEPGTPITLASGSPSTEPITHVYAWFNTKAVHGRAEALNFASNVIAAEHLDGTPNFQGRNCPLPKQGEDAFEEVQGSITPFLIALFILLAFSFLAASFVMFLVTERVTLAKHVQFVSGVNALVYWTGSYAWDLCNITFSNIMILIAIAFFDNAAYTDGDRLWAVAIVLELFGFAVLPLVYLASFIFKQSSSAFAWLSVMFFVASFASLLAVMVLSLPGLGYVDTGFTVKYIAFINPVFTASMAFYDMYQNHLFLDACVGQMRDSCIREEYTPTLDPLQFDDYKVGGVGKHCFALFCTAVGYFIMLMMIEHGIVFNKSESTSSRSKRLKSESVDDDVVAERDMVQRGQAPKDSLVVVNGLRKQFGPKVAVQDLSFTIGKGQCFGLLGVNGAGKTTTFKMLTGETQMTSGSVEMLGMDLASNLRAIRHHVGYCPQFGGLVDTMTGREQLTMFARLRGIPEKNISRIVSKLMVDLNFEVHADKPSRTYSGGNKRKLSTAIALIGNPSVVFLDEPTTGMDPGTRRYLWNVLMDVVKSGRSIVLTSHSMEECEALCTRLAIMVAGQFKCIGSAQHLKNKFSEGYQVNLICGRNVEDKAENIAGLQRFTSECFPDAVLLEAHDLMLSYQVPALYRWSELFEYVKQATEIFQLEDHAISQSSLEQIFLQMAHGTEEAVRQKSKDGGRGPRALTNPTSPPSSPPAYQPSPRFHRESEDSCERYNM